ncbi:hypothetical protein RCH16_000694 [Cryobacterium sp. MP_M5]|uniref:hypothetical protein n=1 Tax=unclassified Cryobacterium TaxID=2649013 RepID=UPI0018C99E2F|nr:MULTISPECIES: hypothetical protein [unclassified Cryobacterium]MBG6057784.1 hypothetical protein [Cryobacterium sp. MP_M3]MEC5175701.1 hypothetical protein [Cryobacterium sp. MP_M5]
MTASESDPFEMPSTTITRGDLTYPARGANPDLLPPLRLIPEAFQHPRAGNVEALQWLKFQSIWFSTGLPATLQLYPRLGINLKDAFDHLAVVQGSYGSKNEHKAAAVAWLASRWFTGYDFDGADPAETE